MKREPAATATYGRKVVRAEAEALKKVAGRLGGSFVQAVQAIHACKGRVVVTGMGKAGIIGQKISATLASTGTPSLWLHPAEATHGDLGRVTLDDVVLALSNSGESEEIKALLPHVANIGARVIAITGGGKSALARYSSVVIDIGKVDEACPLGLAPTASTTAMLAVGDALALAVLKKRKFSKEQYAFYHPAGALRRKLLKVSEVMRKGEQNVCVVPGTPVRKVIAEMTRVRAGAACVVGKGGKLLGLFTDGDLRRKLEKHESILEFRIERVMTPGPRVRVHEEELAAEAARKLREHQFDEAPVVDGRGRCVGILDIQDLLATGLV
ncbi:MAG: KpsF/GutQ family sugar-phosphate isomerase [Planctomycetota bacterium]